MEWRVPQRQTIPGVLSTWASSQPDKTALVIDDVPLTYGDLWARSISVGNALTELGIGPRDTVGVFMTNSPEMVDIWFGSAHIGGIYVPINVSYKGEYLRHQLATARASVVVIDQALAGELARVADQLPHLRHVVIRKQPGAPEPQIPGAGHRINVHTTDDLLAANHDELKSGYEVQWHEPSAVVFTAGTTGPSKGVTMSQNYLVCAARQVYDLRGGTANDITYGALPLFHLAAMSVVTLGPITRGATGALDSKFSATRFWDRVNKFQANHIVTLGAMVMMLWNQEPTDTDANNTARVAVAAPVPPEIHQKFEERFGLTILQLYAQSEAYPLMIAPIDNPAPLGFSGKPNPLFTIKLFDDDDCEVRTGEVGEICVRPNEPHVMSEGYFNNPSSTVDVLRNSWFHTGDLGRFNEEGFFEFVDRKKDYLRRRGENISSFEVERAINLYPGIAEVAVIAAPSDVTEDEVVAVIVPKEGCEVQPKSLMDHCVQNMPYFAVPRYIWYLDELPKNPVGRVEKYKLRDKLRHDGIHSVSNIWDREAEGYVVKR